MQKPGDVEESLKLIRKGFETYKNQLKIIQNFLE